jgi:hypothetical protein
MVPARGVDRAMYLTRRVKCPEIGLEAAEQAAAQPRISASMKDLAAG